MLKNAHFLGLMFVFALPVVGFAADASLFLSPITGTFNVGEPIVIRVMVSTGPDAANAVEGVLRYDPKEIEILGIDRTSSILSSWTREPSFDNSTGELSFAGSMSGTTSYSGPRGEILSFALKGLRSEETRLEFDSGSASAVHAADGTGGNLLSKLSNSVYLFSPQEVNPSVSADASLSSEPPVAPASGEVLGASTGTPALTSSTHPDQASWYNATTSSVEWDLPSGVSAVRLTLDKKENGQGSVRYGAPQHTKEIKDITDGVWYVHMTREWNDGHTDTFHHRVRVDTHAPTDLSLSEVPRSDPTDPNAVFALAATDTPSGIDHYEMSFDSGSPLSWRDEQGDGIYHAPALSSGDHTLQVDAVDRAGNRARTQVTFRVDPLPSPELSQIPGMTFKEGKPLSVEVSGTPRAVLSIAITRDGDSPVVEEYTLDGTGKTTFTSAFLAQPGRYVLSATAKTPNGAISNRSADVELAVEATAWGVLTRHPLIPFAVLGFLLLLSGVWYFFFRADDEEPLPPENNEGYDRDNDALPPQERSRPSTQKGTVVLAGRPSSRNNTSLPITRL